MHSTTLNKYLRNLNDADSSKRRAAAEALSDGDDRVLYPLIKALRDENLGVQDAAMRSLMKLKKESTVYMLLPLLREEAFLRNTAIIILKEMERVAVPLLYVLLRDKDHDIRKFAVDLIYDIQYCTYPEKIVEMLTSDENANVRASAARTLGRLKYKKAVPQLVHALSDEEWVCFSALEALVDMKEVSVTDSIAHLIKSSSDPVRFAAIDTLCTFNTPEAVQSLTDHLRTAKGIEKTATIKSLCMMGSVPPIPGITDFLIGMMKEGDWNDITSAVRGLVSLRDEQALYHLVDAAGSFDLSYPENEEKLSFIKEAIYSFGCSGALISLLRNDSLRYRGKTIAIEIVGELGCKDAVPDLIFLTNHDFRDIRRASITSLSQTSDGQEKDCFIEAIDDSDSHVRKTAATALGKICEKTAFDPLMSMIQNEPYDDVIYECIHALMRIDLKRFISSMDELNDDLKEVAERLAQDFNSGVACR